MTRSFLVIGAAVLMLSLPAHCVAQELRGMDRLQAIHSHHRPPPPVPVSISLKQLLSPIPDNTPILTPIAVATVHMSDGSTNFTGVLGFGAPYYNGTWPAGFVGPPNCYAIQNRTIVIACKLPIVTKAEILSGTITAH
jgi:hypothetical protein